ncbi:MAG TPA: T9SS type A sorting domain-containing protein, partial [Saprospiraceae bacterium]|nr:T9SS type A sorting domain-containing protein [Saprospiraceae bacterium]
MASGRLAPRAFDADGNSSALVLLFTEGGGASLAAGLAFPNPTLGSVALPVYLPEAAGLRFEIFDVSGQSVYTQTGLFEAGARVLQAPAEALSKPGLYAWRLSSGSKTLSGRIVRQ